MKAVIFDFGGVMHSVEGLNTKPTIAEGLGVELESINSVLTDLLEKLGTGTITEDHFWQELRTHTNKDLPDNHKHLIRDNLDRIADLFPEMIQLTHDLKAKGLKIAVLSNTISPHEEVLRKKNAYDLFDVVILSHNAKIRKPDVKIYRMVLDELELDGAECVYIDDLEENLGPAQELGMKTILAKNPAQIIEDLNKLIAE